MNPPNTNRPSWQLPKGVSRGTWDYVTTPSIATEYDAFHRDHPLLQLDQDFIASVAARIEEELRKDPNATPAANVSTEESLLAIDLGCGTGRSLLPLTHRAWKGVGIDLSQDMLLAALAKARLEKVEDRLEAIHANIVELDFLQSSIADLILCMYSSFGMIRGRSHRRQMLQHVARLLKPKGRFIVHVHNRGAWIRDPNGIRLTLEGWVREKRTANKGSGGWELGDRIYAYRGLPSMFLHIFSRRELTADLRSAGLVIDHFMLLNRHSSGPLKKPSLLPHIRAGGFLVECSKSTA